jgi:hypothetical protein
MVLKARATIHGNPNAKTQYLPIPADLVSDSQYPFEVNDEVELELVPATRRLIVRSAPSKKA